MYSTDANLIANTILWGLVGAAIGLAALYGVIRLAVTHAIRATRPQVVAGDEGEQGRPGEGSEGQ